VLKTVIPLLAAALLWPVGALAQAALPVAYNNLAGDGGVALDQMIKHAYAGTYNIVDIRSSAGYTEPKAIAGELPQYIKDAQGQLIVGYALVTYIVSADGAVTTPVIIKGGDERVCRAAMAIMAGWRFRPATLKGVAVASTAAQEFNFGQEEDVNGLKLEHIVVYQPNDVMIRRMPPPERMKSYISQLGDVAHNFFVGDAAKETLSIVVITRPGKRSRVWFVSSTRPGNAPELEPLRRLLEAVPALDVHGGPLILGFTALVAGGDGKDEAMSEEYRNPMPDEWKQALSAHKDSVTVGSDAFIDLVWPDAP
jgi:TonB family protein